MTALPDMERDRSVDKTKPIFKFSVDMTKPIVAQMATKAKWWWMTPMIWGPVVLQFRVKAVSEEIPPHLEFSCILVGLMAWTLFEPNTIHYLLHGFHHKHPMDVDRLVLPPLFVLAFAIPVWCLLRVIIPPLAVCASVFSGMLTGYIVYDLTHYFLHFGTPFTDCLYKLKVC